MTDYDAANKRHIAIASRTAKADDERCDLFVRHVMGLVDGRFYFYRLLDFCHLFDKPFSPDPYLNAFYSGAVYVGQSLFDDIMRLCPDDYVKMMREENVRRATDNARRSRSDKDTDGGDSEPEPYVHPAYREGSGDDRPATANAGYDTDYNPVDRDEG